MPDYSHSKIYRLECSTGHYYIGSTTNKLLCIRLANHRASAKDPRYINTKVYKHINAIGWDNVKIVLIESVSCRDKDDLNMKENEYVIKALGDDLCLNHNRVMITDNDRIQADKNRKARLKAERNTIVKCECGTEHTVGRTQQHQATAKHRLAMEALNK